MQTECKQAVFEFQGVDGKKVTVDFQGGYLSSDGGGLFLRELEERRGVLSRLAGCFEDLRDERYVEHALEELLRQRVFALALGYEDLNDHDRLRLDPLHALLAGKKEVTGAHRVLERDQGKPLAAHSTLNRLELGAQGTDGRYKKIAPDVQKMEAQLIQEGVRAIPRRVREIVLDFDATDDPLHGAQEGGFFHGFYRDYCYLPLYCFCGNIPLLARLRDCKRDASEGSVEALEKIVCAIRKRFGQKVRIIVRGDSGFAREEIMAWCEAHRVYYCFGLARNERLTRQLEAVFAELHGRIEAGESSAPCREFVEFEYRTLESWSGLRRVIGKAEVLEKGDNPRFVVTNLPAQGWEAPKEKGRFEAAALYEKFYCARGDMENRIKEQQQDLFADRTSTHWMASNQLRLWFSAFAHLLLSILRAEVLRGTELAQATVGQIRLQLFKIAARITVSCRRIHIELASAYPWQRLFAKAHRQLAAVASG
jgi:Transposase DDE domain group 1